MVKKRQIEGPRRAGRKPSLNAGHTTVLRAILQEQPRPSLDEVTRALFRRTGVKVSTVTVRKALREAGIERLKPLRRVGERAAVQGAAPTRYGYTDAHCRADGPSGMNTDLTDAEWALVSDLFERDGRRGAPPRHARRHMVNACCYVLRTGCAWRLLPKTFPPSPATYMAFRRWAAAGVFETRHDRLRQQWRERVGKAPEPTAATIDAQSTRSTGTWQDAQRSPWPEVLAKGFVVQAKRWVVERPHACNERARRLMAHHDRSHWAALAWVWLAQARNLASRLAA